MARLNYRKQPAYAPHGRRWYYNGSQLWRRMYVRGPGVSGETARNHVPIQLQRAYRARRARIPLERRIELADQTRLFHQTKRLFTTGVFFTPRGNYNANFNT